MDTLAFCPYALDAASCARDFHPLDHAHAGRTKIDREAFCASRSLPGSRQFPFLRVLMPPRLSGRLARAPD